MHARESKKHAFTLAELVLSMAIMTLIMGAATSAMLIASHGLPDPQSDRDTLSATQEALRRISQDMLYATSFSKMNSVQARFKVADRGHGLAGPEDIRYRWDGLGSPLERTYNGATPIDLAAGKSVTYFRVTYRTKTDAQGQAWLRSITIELQLGSDAANKLQAEVHLLNDIDDQGNPASG